ncbi:histidinol-phosphatase HisJ family protein [Clostridium frigidicarnis]|uniref:Histidinol-phosphatase n=1 Tax=Clostridium frigidicarnis TaxID=84698 RepID=A0A1I0VNI0_9CLOT|nr:histidinol-phosphatase HisJ family protein [Clostridium frigidicarnis]SFA77146.1 histidinol-phosphatase (PHP family) [Clostridium frigidicarnis]
MFDCHVHSNFSTDCKEDIINIIEKGKKDNVGITVTDHMDLNYPDLNLFRFNVDEYLEKYWSLRNDKFCVGIELGMGDEIKEENNELVKKYNFDQIIGSIHMIEGNDIFQKETYREKSKREVYEKYFSSMEMCIRTHDYINILAHIDYISRYSTYNDTEIWYREFSDYIDEVLKRIIERDIALELNTRRFNSDSAIKNTSDILKRYKELGGVLITLGSDSHTASSVGNNFFKAKDLVKNMELKNVYYRCRKIQDL